VAGSVIGVAPQATSRALAAVHNTAVFLSGTLLNVVTVLLGTAVGLLIGRRMPERMQESLVTGLGFFTVLISISLGLRMFTDPLVQPGDELAVLAALLAGVAIGELLRIQDGLEALGAWFQKRLVREADGATDARSGSRVAEGFVTASLVFCVGPLTILGSLQNGLTGDAQLLAIKSLLDGVAAIAFAAALGWGVALSAITVLVIQGGIAAFATVLEPLLDEVTILAITATGGIILLGVALRLLDLKPVRVANFLPALVLAPVFVRVADLVRGWLG
jgi:uncharacterized membrane protein YqgA involved in biofilm formation